MKLPFPQGGGQAGDRHIEQHMLMHVGRTLGRRGALAILQD
jgi:hypothetical protein